MGQLLTLNIFAGAIRPYGLWLAGLILLVLLVGMAFALYRTRKVERGANQAKFRDGIVPKPLPNGFYKGSAFTGLGKHWQGKVFQRSNSTGINQFTDGQRYTFATYPATGLRDPDLQVLRIDYGQPGNPWWVRLITDEIVQTAPGHYLGKVHARFWPGLVFSLGYFELTAQ
jgi:hypothetical protein